MKPKKIHTHPSIREVEVAFQKMIDSNFDVNIDKSYQVNASPSFAALLCREQKTEYRTAQNGNSIFEIDIELEVTEESQIKHGLPEIIKVEIGVVVDSSLGHKFKGKKPGSPFRIYPIDRNSSVKVEAEPTPTFMSDLRDI